MTIPFWTSEGTIDLLALRPHDLTALILGNTLAKMNRFGGRTSEPWPITSHLALVEYLCPQDLRGWALLHDANAAFLGDLMIPAQEYLCRAGSRVAVENAISNAKGKLNRTIASAWKVVDRSMSRRLLEADQIAVQAEASMLLGIRPEFVRPTDREDFDLATDFIQAYGPGSDWRSSRDLWLFRIQNSTRLGGLTPPQADDPLGMSPGV